MATKLYVIHGSHPCRAVERALQLKGIAYTTAEYVPPMHVPIQRLRFGARTVPSIRFEDGETLSGSRPIMRRLEERRPEPSLYPADAAARAQADEAERWGDEVFQPVARRILWQGFSRDSRAMAGYQEGSKLPALPMPLLRALAPGVTFLERRLNGADEATVRADLLALPAQLDRIDAWIAEGVLGSDPPGAADLQIAATLRLILTVADVRPLIDARPAGALARRVFPDHPGEVPAGTFPAAWLPAPGR
jgi:glutathione S-transferase